MCENACDERIVLDQNMEFKRRYGRLINETIEKKEIHSNALIISFSGNKKLTKERIRMMKNVKRLKRLVRVFSTVVAMSATLLRTATVLAYEEASVVTWEQERKEIKTKLISSDLAFNLDDEKINSIEDITKVSQLEEDREIFIKYGFIDGNGNYYEIDNNNNGIQQHWLCNHSWKSGTVAEHNKWVGGGCEYILYSASKCSKCSDIRVHSEYESHNYRVCPH